MNNKKRVFFLDTNMIINKNLSSFLGGRDLLNHISKKGGILIPNMVLREIEKQKKDSFEQVEKDLKALECSFNVFLNHMHFDKNQKTIEQFNIDKHIKTLKEKEEIKFKDIKINNESKAFQDIQDLAVNTALPFHEINKHKDIGFKDAVIYITIKEWVEENSSNGEHYIYFLSNDEKLREAVQKNLDIRCIPEKVQKEKDSSKVQKEKDSSKVLDEIKKDIEKYVESEPVLENRIASNNKNYTVLFMLNIHQPISIDGLENNIKSEFEAGEEEFKSFDFNGTFSTLEKEGVIDSFKLRHSETKYYFITKDGRNTLTVVIRKKIDLSRLMLLKKAKRDIIDMSCSDGDSVWGGVSSARINWDILKTCEVQKPKVFWLRMIKKSTDLPTGKPSEQDFFPEEYIKKILNKYSINLLNNPIKVISYTLGVSISLIESMTNEQKKEKTYYRTFYIKKKSGGKRKIEAPRIMLKTVQRFIADYILIKLPVHKNVYSYIKGKSIVNNASLHNNKNYLISMDIEDFFGSISHDKLTSYFGINHSFNSNSKIKNGNVNFGEKLSYMIINLCTKDGSLPQGAPTSPILSNAILYNFDQEITELCEKDNISYTRYADDISISGNDKNKILEIQEYIKNIIEKDYGFKINDKKNKFASKSMRHKVTGIVVNEKIKPSRHWMKVLQQKFNYAKKFEDKRSPEIHKKLAGNVSYLNGFPYYKNEKKDLILKYKKYLKEIEEKIEQDQKKQSK